jgi:hypothetical protein
MFFSFRENTKCDVSDVPFEYRFCHSGHSESSPGHVCKKYLVLPKFQLFLIIFLNVLPSKYSDLNIQILKIKCLNNRKMRHFRMPDARCLNYGLIAKNCPKRSKTAKKGQNWPIMFQNDEKMV